MKRIWVLLGSRKGDNNQLLALAEALGMPFETRTLEYNRLWAPLLALARRSPLLLTRKSRRTLVPPWPDVTIGIGRRSVAVARWIRCRNQGRTQSVRIGNPRADTALFNLVVTTRQYPVPEGANVLVLPVAMGRHCPRSPSDGEDGADFLGALSRPHLLLIVGGPTRFWKLDTETIIDAALRLRARAAQAGGTLVIVRSPRTPAGLVQELKDRLSNDAGGAVAIDPPVPYAALLGDADELFVTADSVSMISEAVVTGKPVGLVPVELDSEGERLLGTAGYSPQRRDLRRFWAAVEERGLVGTIDQPRRARVDNPVEIAAEAVRRLLGDSVE